MLEVSEKKPRKKLSVWKKVLFFFLALVSVLVVGNYMSSKLFDARVVDGTYHLMRSNSKTLIAYLDDSQSVSIEGSTLKIDDGEVEKIYQIDTENKMILNGEERYLYQFLDDTLWLTGIESGTIDAFVRIGSEKYKEVQEGKIEFYE